MKMREMKRSKLEQNIKDGVIECVTDITASGVAEIRYLKSKKLATVQVVEDAPVEEVKIVAEPPSVPPASAPAKKERVSKRPYLNFVLESLEAGLNTRKELQEKIMVNFPGVSRGGVQTFITDLFNVKYSHFKPRKIVKLAEGQLIFEDRTKVIEEVEEREIRPPDEVREY
jgi:hypothetical protein